MTRPPAIITLFLFLVIAVSTAAQEESRIIVEALTEEGEVKVDLDTRTAVGTNGVIVRYEQTVLVADSVSVDQDSGETIATGNVRIHQDDQTWVSDRIAYNFKTRQMISDRFRIGEAPLFAEGAQLQGDITNKVYRARSAMLTTDDISRPAIRIRARRITIVPGKRVEASHAVLYLGPVPVFYYPFYVRNLGPRANNLTFTPGYRSSFGPFVLGSYTWFLNEQIDGELHVDYRVERGPGAGPDINFHLGRWGEGTLKYYYTHDDDPETNRVLNAPVFENRHRVHFSWLANPFTNFTARALVRYQSDIGVIHDFFESEYRRDPQPDSYFELNKFWRNFSLDVLTQPRLNEFYETVVRLPDVRLTGFRQQIFGTPFFYESESTLGYYRRLFAETNLAAPGLDFEAARADTYHQIVLPATLFGWLNLTPRAGGRFTYYSEATGPGAATDEAYRGVFNTGAELTFKASRLWPNAHSEFLEVNGLRHIVQPSVNYVYVPRPNEQPDELPQFDYELASLRLLPIEYPQYNSIDSIDSQNVLRFGLRNRLQTKRDGEVEDFLDWEVMADWRLRPRSDQETFGDLYSDFQLRPRSWLTLQSLTRFDINDEDLRMSLTTLTFRPNTIWSWGLGHFYLQDDLRPSPTALGPGNNLITSSLFLRVNENWGFRASHHFNARGGRMQEQLYTVYRDLRSWTAALTAGLRDNGDGDQDITVAFAFSFKARPRYNLGQDSVRPYSLLGR